MNALILTKTFIEAFDQKDYDLMEEQLVINLLSFVTQRNGHVKCLKGRSAFMKNIHSWDDGKTQRSICITQIHPIHAQQCLVMIAIKAKRGEQQLKNYAAFLINTSTTGITEIYMVEANPETSDTFWNKGTK